MNMAITVMITDDHSMIREGLKNLLELDGDIKVIAEAENGVECLEQLNQYSPDVLLLDINMPKMNGLEVLQNIKERHLKVKVLVLTVHNEVEYLMKAIDIGVEGYILKELYGQISLTEKGREIGRLVYDKHKTIKEFLIKIGVSEKNAEIESSSRCLITV